MMELVPARPRSHSEDPSLSPTPGSHVIAIKPRPPPGRAPAGSHHTELAPRRGGDVEAERAVEARVRALGLWHAKTTLEDQLRARLAGAIDQDQLFQALNRARRKRPLGARVARCAERITDLIRTSIVADAAGTKLRYQVHVLMGLFTRDVGYEVVGNAVIVRGLSSQEGGVSLEKEVRIEFPANVDISRAHGSFMAGVFYCEAPFRGVRMERSRSSGSLSSGLSQYSSVSDDRNNGLM